jgi:hypothetical protein
MASLASESVESPRPGPRAFLPLNSEYSSLGTHGGTLGALITSRSSSSIHNMLRRPSTFRPRRDDEEDVLGSCSRSHLSIEDEDDPNPRKAQERRLSTILQVRSQRLIGNSNPRYSWQR